MQMRKFRGLSAGALLSMGMLASFAQTPSQTKQPTVTSLSAVPSEPLPQGACTASWSGYLHNKDKRPVSDLEIGKFIASSLRDGYIVVAYPKTESGIFIDLECPKTNGTAALPSNP
jgi:hypothetical protein